MKDLTQEVVDQLESRLQHFHSYVLNAIDGLNPDVRADIQPYLAPSNDIGEMVGEVSRMRDALHEAKPIINSLLDLVRAYENFKIDVTGVEAGYQYKGKDVWEIKQDEIQLLHRYRFVVDIDQAMALYLVEVEMERMTGKEQPPLNLNLTASQAITLIDQGKSRKSIINYMGELVKNHNFDAAREVVQYAFNKYQKPVLN